MTDFNLEQVYDEQITPLMTQIIEICDRYQMPFYACFEFADQSFCKTLLTYEDRGHPVLKHMDVIRQCALRGGVNVDKYIMWLMRTAEPGKHTSVCLSNLGIPSVLTVIEDTQPPTEK